MRIWPQDFAYASGSEDLKLSLGGKKAKKDRHSRLTYDNGVFLVLAVMDSCCQS